MIDPADDAFGTALLDYLAGRPVPELTLEVKGGSSGPAMHPEWFFRSFESWDWWKRELLPLVSRGPVLDLGAGSRRLLTRLAELTAPGAVLVGDSVTPAGSPRVDLRIRYKDLITPWWPQYNIPPGRWPPSSTAPAGPSTSTCGTAEITPSCCSGHEVRPGQGSGRGAAPRRWRRGRTRPPGGTCCCAARR